VVVPSTALPLHQINWSFHPLVAGLKAQVVGQGVGRMISGKPMKDLTMPI